MRIAKIEDLHCAAGWRDFSFLKITTDEGLVGWSEFLENFGAEGLSTVIQRLGQRHRSAWTRGRWRGSPPSCTA